MERRYLVAALAIIATFAVASRGFRTVERIASTHGDHHFWTLTRVALARTRCDAFGSHANAMANLRNRMHARSAEEVQLLAEMNVPMANLESTIDEQMSRQEEAIARSARERAMQQAERARTHAMEQAQRDAMRLQEKMSHAAAYSYSGLSPISVEVNVPPDLDRRIQTQMTAMAARFAENSVRLTLTADKLRDNSMRMVTVDVPDIEITPDGISTHVHTHVHCKSDVQTSH